MCYILGLATRLCDGDPAVWQPPNVDECSTVEITRIAEEVNYLLAIVAASQDPNNSDRTTTIESDAFESLSDELASAIDKDNTTILPNDLRNTIESVGGLLRYTTVSTCTYINQLSWIMIAYYVLNYTIVLLKAAHYDTGPDKTTLINT